MNFHTLKAEEVLKKLKTSIKGLSKQEAKLRLGKHGLNRLPEAKRKSRILILLEQFKSPLIYILAVAGLVTLFLNDYTDAIVIWLAVGVNAVIGYIQEAKANNALAEIKKIITNKVIVIRDGKEKLVNQEHITIGDVTILRPGDKVPADGRIIESNDLKINEAALTGEWAPVEKRVESLDKETFFADRVNMAFMGTVIESGFGQMVITAVARHTEFGRVAKLIKETEESETPYQKRLGKFSKVLGGVFVVICVFIFIQGIATQPAISHPDGPAGGEFVEMFTTAVAVAVAAIPEGLPMAITVILAIGMQKILKRKGLVRKLASAETLGSTSVICTDKTGTLTQGKMEVGDIIADDKDEIRKIITLLSEAFVEKINGKLSPEIFRGRPTDKALLAAGELAGYSKEKLSKNYNEIDRIPFSSAQKFSAALFSTGKSSRELLVMGAPEVIFERCKNIRISELNRQVNKMTGEGLRVLAVAHRNSAAETRRGASLHEDDINGLQFLGFVTLKDPLRAGAKQAIKICQQAGMRTVIITGDHKLTAKAIANELGLRVKDSNILEGKDLEKLTDKQLHKTARDIIVYARVMPEHKLRIINAWQSLGKVVAMTGDGINDAPALKKADVGVALGSGTTIAKEVSDLILLNDDFSVIVAAIEEGRGIVDNIRKVITYLLSGSFSEIILISAAIILGWPLPVLAVHILWVNLIEDGLPNFALAFEPKENDIMKRPPIARSAPLLNGEMKFLIFVIGVLTNFMLLGMFYYFYQYSGYSLIHTRSLMFAALAIDSRFFVYSCRSLRKNIWRVNLFSNKLLLLSTIIGTALLAVVFYHPALQAIFKTVPLTLFDWSLLVALGLANIAFIELGKSLYIRRKEVN
ncbi:ATPase [Candidatus Falkowbacteria bacterium CG10_big_fil_rev_8_21_14_0_10_43_10]|uniref:ATPase n=1 Tax=Candidatus Falkowbacteria bacterium CG10_big_fil_rev_8_21_14_0_10_43_10 TaxID=1974567 RepID=A0A2H0V310_9BACT|nr:MAG: ATPase [Candidatus Falkowbacteria bacterium CG10_big_fil_rev_8_21_14_0_10_43_10]